MSPLPDIEPLLPDDARRRARRDSLVAELDGAVDDAALTRRRFVRGGLTLAGMAAVGLAGTAIVPGLRGTPVDVLASARAAAAPDDGGIVHALVRYHHGPYVFMGTVYEEGEPNASSDRRRHNRVVGTHTGDVESWSTTNPLRHRAVRFLEAPGGGRATIQRAYAHGVVATRNSWEPNGEERSVGDRERRRTVRDLTGRSGGRLAAVSANGDPVAAIRALLDRGRLRDAGETDVDGRRVRRLKGRELGHVDGGGPRRPPVDFEYLVDADSFDPVRITSVQVLPARPDDPEPAARRERRIVDRWDFEAFERLPFNAETAKLLTIDGAGRMPSPNVP